MNTACIAPVRLYLRLVAIDLAAIPSAVSAIKKNINQKRGADVRRHPAFDLLGEHRPCAIAQGGAREKRNAACGGRILEKQGVAVGLRLFSIMNDEL